MATVNYSVLACNYAVNGIGSSENVSSKLRLSSNSGYKLPVLRAQQSTNTNAESTTQGRRAALVCLGAALFAVASNASGANAGVIEEYLEKSKANKELNDQKRLATSGANFARANTVSFGSCSFPYNFTGCQDLAKQKKVKFLSDDLEIECKGKEKYQCGSNVFWKW